MSGGINCMITGTGTEEVGARARKALADRPSHRAATVPLVILTMGKLVALPVRGWIGHRVAVHRECPLATPIVPWAALPFFHRGIEPIRILSPDMRTLISLGVGAAPLCSLVAMVGVGVNDAPAPAAADVGIPMSTGADVAVESTGITLMRGDLAGLVRARKLSAALIRFLPSAPMPRHSDGRLALSRIRRADTGASRPVGLDAGRPSSGPSHSRQPSSNGPETRLWNDCA